MIPLKMLGLDKKLDQSFLTGLILFLKLFCFNEFYQYNNITTFLRKECLHDNISNGNSNT